MGSQGRAVDGSSGAVVLKGIDQHQEVTAKAGDLRWKGLGHRLEPAFEGATSRVATVLDEECPHGLHLALLQDGQQAMHFGQMTHDHDHQRLQEQVVRIDLGSASTAGRDRHRDAINEPQEGASDGCLGYHMAVSYHGCGNHMVRGRRVGS